MSPFVNSHFMFFVYVPNSEISLKKIPTLHNIISLIIVLFIGCFIHLFLLLLQHDIESNPGLKKKQVKSLSCCHWNVDSLLARNLSKISQTGTYNSPSSHDFICISETYFDLTILEQDKSFHLNCYNLLRADHPNNKARRCLHHYIESLGI